MSTGETSHKFLDVVGATCFDQAPGGGGIGGFEYGSDDCGRFATPGVL